VITWAEKACCSSTLRAGVKLSPACLAKLAMSKETRLFTAGAVL